MAYRRLCFWMTPETKKKCEEHVAKSNFEMEHQKKKAKME